MGKVCRVILILLALHVWPFALTAIEYTQKDRDILIEIRTKLHEIDKRFEQIDKRFDDLKIYMGLLTTITIAVLSYVMYRIHRIEDKNDNRSYDKIIIAMRELAQTDPKMQKALKVVGLL